MLTGKLPLLLRPESSILRQSGLILLISGLADLFPGLIMGRFESYLVLVPGLIILLPPTIGIRGNTFGSLAARLGSKLHLGEVEPSLKGNRVLGKQLNATFVQLLVLSAFIPFAGALLSLVFPIEMAPLSQLLFISLIGGLLSGAMMFSVTLGITLFSFRKGLDPDNVSAPIIGTTGDIMTLPALFLAAWIALMLPLTVTRTISIFILLGILVYLVLIVRPCKVGVGRILRSSVPFAFLAVLISSLAGMMLQANFDVFFKGTIFLLLIPAFNAQGGSMGSILGSRLTSSAYLGQDRMTLEPSPLSIRSWLSLWFISLGVFFSMSVVGTGLSYLTDVHPGPYLQLALIMVLGATMVSTFSSIIAYYMTYLSFRMGLDPDNVVIPILTACMDVVGSGSLIICILFVTSVL